MNLNSLTTPALPTRRPNPLHLAAILLFCVAAIVAISLLQSLLAGADLTPAANAAAAPAQRPPAPTSGSGQAQPAEPHCFRSPIADAQCIYNTTIIEVAGLDAEGNLALRINGYPIVVLVPQEEAHGR